MHRAPKTLRAVLICILFFSFFHPQKVLAIDVSAKYACVIDAVSGKVLFEKNAYKRHSMASTTKIMTAYLALTHLDLNKHYDEKCDDIKKIELRINSVKIKKWARRFPAAQCSSCIFEYFLLFQYFE